MPRHCQQALAITFTHTLHLSFWVQSYPRGGMSFATLSPCGFQERQGHHHPNYPNHPNSRVQLTVWPATLLYCYIYLSDVLLTILELGWTAEPSSPILTNGPGSKPRGIAPGTLKPNAWSWHSSSRTAQPNHRRWCLWVTSLQSPLSPF